MRSFKPALLFFALVLLAGCGSNFADMFEGPVREGGTPNEIQGLWSLNQEQPRADVRVRIGRSEVAVAVKCTEGEESVIIGQSVPAEVTDKKIVLKEAINQEKFFGSDAKCYVQFASESYEVEISGIHAYLSGQRRQVSLTKIADS